MDNVVKKVTTTTIKYGLLTYDADKGAYITDMEPFIVDGKASKTRANIIIRKRHKSRTANYIVTDLEYDTHTYAMATEDFIKLAERMD